MGKRICAGTRKDGRPCETIATADGYCFAHSAACQERTAQARAEGSRNSSKAVRARKRMGADLREIAVLLEDTMKSVSEGRILPSQGHALASLAGAWVRVYELAEMEQRLEDLEAKLEPQTAARGWR